MKCFRLFGLTTLLLLVTIPGLLLHGGETKPVAHSVKSADGIPIQYDVWGKDSGGPALVFVHGWCCSRTFWEKQIPYFSKLYKVVTLDLAGHGESGRGRKKYTLDAFAQDVAAVVKKLDLKKVILVGHSMGGPVIALAAPLLPNRVVGLVGVDTFNNVEVKLNPKEAEWFMAPLRADFVKGTQTFIRMFMFTPQMDTALKDKILKDMSSAPAEVGISAMEEIFKCDLPEALEKANVPLHCINADQFPTNVEAIKRRITSFKMKILPQTGHFLMMEKPGAFNKLLDETVKELASGE